MRKGRRLSAGSGRFTRFTALLCAAALLYPVSSRQVYAASEYYPPRQHSETAYSEMPRTGIDLAETEDTLRRFERDPARCYEELLELVDMLETQVSLAEIESSIHGADEPLSDALEQEQLNYSMALDLVSESLENALSGPRGDELRALMPEWAAEGFEGYEGLSNEYLERTARESELVQDYYLLPRDKAFHDAAAEIYLELAQLRREEAEEAGYGSYADYAYETVYGRDFTPSEMSALRQVVKDRVAPLYLRCELASYAIKERWDAEDVPDAEEILDLMEEHLPHVSPELMEAFSYLRRNRLYCIGEDEEMLDMGYTLSLPAYGSAFLFNRLQGRMDALSSTVHEFGHFNAAYHDPTPALYTFSNIDVSELQSQGLELLFLPCLQDILAGDNEEQRTLVELIAVSNMLSSVVDGFLYDEFEQYVYRHPDLDPKDLHELEVRLLKEYGLNALYGTDVFWTEVGHLFEQPFYYISYAVSALSALDVWQLGLRDREEAVDAYLRVSAADTSEWFLDVLEECGLQDVTDAVCVERVMDGVEDHFADRLSISPLQRLRRLAVPAVIGAAAVLVALPLLRSVRKRGAEPDEPGSAPGEEGDDGFFV